MRKFLFLFLSILCTNVFSQNSTEKVLKNNHLIENGINIITVPFQLIQNFIVIDNITVNHLKGKFIFDTGNGAALMLNSEVFITEVSNAKKNNSADSGKGITGSFPVFNNLKIDSAVIGDFVFSGLNATAFNLDPIKNEIDKDLLGFIGYGIISEVEFIIDYDKKNILFYRLNDEGNPIETSTYIKKELLDFTIDNGSVIANISFGGKMLNFLFDTGALKNTLNSDFLPEIDKTYISFTGLKDTIGGADGTVLLSDDALMTQFRIKDTVFDNMATDVYSTHDNSKFDAILGYPFFKQKIFAFNYKKKKIYICK